MPRTQSTLAPGARVVIRDEEWIVRHIEESSFGGAAVTVVGTSELVRGKEAIFLSDLDEIQELRPEETELVVDPSPHHRRTRLYLEALLRRTPPTDDALMVGPRGAIQQSQYQMQPAAKALRQLRPRILMADGVGLGKTIEVGILLSELIRRGRGRRILVVALKSILAQFQQELWARFTIPLVRLDSVGIQRVQTEIPSNMNPFYYYDRVIVSIDTLKRDTKYRKYLEECRWDAVVVDECQNVAVRGRSAADRSQRARLAQLLASQCDALILTSATPHDGRPESFASLIDLLEPTAIADKENYSHEEVKDFFLRRFKKDIRHEVQGAFHDRELHSHHIEADPAEEALMLALRGSSFPTIDQGKGGAGLLFRTTLLKALLSSPVALRETLAARTKTLGERKVQDDDVAKDLETLGGLDDLAGGIRLTKWPKYLRLLEILRGIGIGGAAPEERVVIFSERIATLQWLEKQLMKDLGLKSSALEIFHGQLDDQKQQALVKSFGVAGSPIRVLLCSDVASEGINLHYHCRRLIHFDMPWSLITIEQRNGRIDRYGQSGVPEIHCLLTVPKDEGLRGDLRILERLVEKEDAAYRNLGDAAWLLKLHDAEKESDHIGRGIETGKDAEEIIPDEPQGVDLLQLILGGDEGVREPEARVVEPVSMFDGELDYVRHALAEVFDEEPIGVEWHEHLKGLTLRAPEDLRRRYRQLPVELRDDEHRFKLTVDRELVMKALEEARGAEGRWPEWQLLWEQHPVAEWIDDRLLQVFQRHEAPLLRASRGLDSAECVFLFQGVLSNQRAQTVIVDWFGIGRSGGRTTRVLPLSEFIELAGLRDGATNPAGELPARKIQELQRELPSTVQAAAKHMATLRQQRATAIGAPLRESLRALTRWRDQRIAVLEAAVGGNGDGTTAVHAGRRRRLDEQQAEVVRVHDERKEWIDRGLKTVEVPYLRLAAVLIGG